MSSTREHATIRKARYGIEEDHGVLVFEVSCDFKGSVQAFQACVDEQLGSAMVGEVCELFGVSKVEQLVGRQCFALRAWPYSNEAIEGFEVDGRRWTRSDCVRRHAPDHFKDPLKDREEQARERINSLTVQIQTQTNDLARLCSDFVDWTAPEKPGGGT